MTSASEEFSSVYALVEHLLEVDERCRNSDKWLTYRVMQHYTDDFVLPFKDLAAMPAFETPKRVRAQIQNVERRFLPTADRVLEKRGRRSASVKEWVAKESVSDE